MKKIIAVLFIVAIACAPKQTVKTVSPEEYVSSDTIVVIKEEPKNEVTPKVEENITPETTAYGYRVQIFASWTHENAERIATEARQKFGKEPVYVEYIAPLYRVRVGDCRTREEAERLRDLARSLGYEDAFIVKTNINVR